MKDSTKIEGRNHVTVTVPTCLFHGLINTQEYEYKIVDRHVINDIVDYAVYDEYRHTIPDLETVFDKLRLVNSKDGMEQSLERGKEVAGNITTKSHYYVDLYNLIDLRDQHVSFDRAVCQLMYYALGSIQGRKPFTKTINQMVLSRMDGYDTMLNDPGQLSPDLQRINTRRKMEKYRKMLTENYGVAFYSNHMHGYFFTTKLSKYDKEKRSEMLKTIVEKSQIKQR